MQPQQRDLAVAFVGLEARFEALVARLHRRQRLRAHLRRVCRGARSRGGGAALFG